MSTLPRGSHNAVDTPYQAAVPLAPFPLDYEPAVREFERAAKALSSGPPSEDELRHFCRQIAALTADLFPGEIAVKVKNDPELAGDLYIVFHVATASNLEEIMTRSREWYLSVRGLAGRWSDMFCLSFDVLQMSLDDV